MYGQAGRISKGECVTAITELRPKERMEGLVGQLIMLDRWRKAARYYKKNSIAGLGLPN
ncbi:MAG: hypothetical protein JRN19_04205 [Nitrososphaerota archaeon]|nr:hypothetical protein [Nitrososphaerota archaeon]MDG7049154.1 hypothetical protein [Nitrososphaerota archaeon]MDG7051635.1 hypothetical protein [Nitrososphaerota archaeon]